MPPLTPLFPGRPDLVARLARLLVQPCRGHHREHAAGSAPPRSTRCPVRGLTPPSTSVAPITARSSAVTEQRALPRVDVGGVVGIEGRCSRSSRAAGRCPGCGGGGRPRLVHVLVEDVAADPAKGGQPLEHVGPLSSTVEPGSRLVVAMAPAFTMRVHRAAVVQLDGHDRVERQPGGVDAEQLGAASIGTDARRTPARTRTAWTRSGWRTARRRRRPTRVWPCDADDARAERVRRGLGEGGDVVGHLAVVDRSVALVRPPPGGAARRRRPGSWPVETNALAVARAESPPRPSWQAGTRSGHHARRWSATAL